MTISRILLLPFCAFKIIINFDRFKSIIFYKKEKIGEKTNAIFVYATLLITCICASLYQNIVGYITIIGGIFVPIPIFIIPQIYIGKLANKNKLNFRIIFGIFLWILGIVGSILGIIEFFKLLHN